MSVPAATFAPVPYDLVIVGGGVNGIGIARDAAGRGLGVLVLEGRDLAAATSSASSKLIHGGLRYLEHSEFRLVRESLKEREVLWTAAPHIVHPLRFVLPVRPGMRPAWVLRTGLFLYDHIGGREHLPPTRTLRRGRAAAFAPLRDSIRTAFEYSDCAVDDARLVVLNAIDAHEHGAAIAVGWRLTGARRAARHWNIDVESSGGERRTVQARGLINAAGPWVTSVLASAGVSRHRALRLVKGSHLVLPRLYTGRHAYTLQAQDGRVIFAVPYGDSYTLLGTTEIPYAADAAQASVSDTEVDYLCRGVGEYLREPIEPKRVVWAYAGVRPLYDDGSVDASTVTRDYVFDIDAPPDAAPILSVFGGKLTTYRRLAEHALAELLPRLHIETRPWTRGAVLPGGDFPNRDIEAFTARQCVRYDFLPPSTIRRMCRAYGTRIERIIGAARSVADLGDELAPGLFAAELAYLRREEWARCADDVLWRRSKLGLQFDASVVETINRWFAGGA